MSSVFGAKKEGKVEGELKQEAVKGKIEIVESGIPGFDESLGQGLPAGSLYLVSGPLGTNQGLFAQQIMYHRIISKEKVAYYTVEKSGNDIIDDMKLFGMKIQEFVDDGSWIFGRALTPNLKKLVDVLPESPMEQKIELSDSLSPLMKHFQESVKNGCSTTIHLSHLIQTFSLEEIQNLLFFMTGVAREFGGIHFILMTEDAHDQNSVIAIKDAVDTVFAMSSSIRGNELENNVTLKKIRNMFPKTWILRFNIKKNGLVTETIRRFK